MKACEIVKRMVSTYLAYSRALVATAIALVLRAMHVRLATVSSIFFLQTTYNIVVLRLEMSTFLCVSRSL